MNTNYCQVVEMTDEQKREMYGKCSKEELIEFLIQKEKTDIIFKNDTGSYIPKLDYSICTT